MLQLNHLSYTYSRGIEAIVDINVHIGPGIHLLLGANGAGKTTLLHLVSALRFPTSGSCIIDGNNSEKRNPSMMQKLFFLDTEMQFPYPTIAETAQVLAPFYPNFSAADLEENLKLFGQKATDKLQQMSMGTRRKALLAFALSLHTEILLLDEPANGLDITAKQQLASIMARSIAPNQTVIVSTHTVQDLRTLFDSVIVLSQGRLILNTPIEHIASRLQFGMGFTPRHDALFQQMIAGTYHYILPLQAEAISSEVNLDVLYSSLMSPSRDAILQLL